MESSTENTTENTAGNTLEPSGNQAVVPENPLLRHLTLTVSVEELEKKIDEELRQIGRTAKMQGFRPGKVPFKVLKQQYGGEASNRALSSELNRLFMAAVIEQKIRVVGQPHIAPAEKTADETTPTTLIPFVASFEVYPDIELKDISGKPVERFVYEITEADVDKTIDVLRKQRMRFDNAARPAQKEDRVVIDFLGKKDGVPFDGGAATDYPFVLGQGMMLKDFEDQVEGCNAGDSKTFNMTFPEDYSAKDIAGKEVTFDIQVKQVQEPRLPALDESFARSMGVADGDILKFREEVTNNLKMEVKTRLENQVKNQVMTVLIEAHPLPVPQTLVQNEITRMAEKFRSDMAERGIQNTKLQAEWFIEPAHRQVHLGLLLAEILKAESLYAKPEQIRALVEEQAARYEDAKEVIAWFYADASRRSNMEGLVIEKNVVDWSLSKMQVTDKAVTFDELMGNNGAGQAA